MRGVGRPLTLLLVLALLLGGILTAGYLNRTHVHWKAFPDHVRFENPHQVVTGGEQEIYVISDSRQLLTAISAEGEVILKLEPEELPVTDAKPNRDFVNFSDVAVDSGGNVYVLQQVMDFSGLSIRREEIVRYTANGKLDQNWSRIVKHYDRDKLGTLRKQTIKSMQVVDDQLYFFVWEQPRLQLKKLDMRKERTGEGAETAKTRSVEALETLVDEQLPASVALDEVYGTDPDAVVYSTMQGEIYRLGGKLLYPLQGASDAVPENLRLDERRHVLFLDGWGAEVKEFPLDAPEQIATRLQAEDGLISLDVAADGSLLLGLEDGVARSEAGSSMERVRYADSVHAERWLTWAGTIAAGLLVLWMLKILYADLMPMSILLKQLMILVPMIAAAMSLLSSVLYQDFQESLLEEEGRGLIYVAHEGQNLLDGERLQRLSSPRTYGNADYEALKSKLSHEEQGKYYTLAYLRQDGKLHEVLENDDDMKMFEPLEEDYFEQKLCRQRTDDGNWTAVADMSVILDERKFVMCEEADQNGSWVFALGPLFSPDKQHVVGVYEAGIHKDSLDQRLLATRNKMIGAIAACTGALLLIVLLVSYLLLSPLRKLSSKVDEVAQGNWSVVVEATSRDEVGQLGRRFNEMARSINSYLSAVTALSESYFRFVPEAFLKILGKDSILDVKLGDQVMGEMTMLVANIRGFQRVTKGMSPAETFEFLNGFLGRVSPVVHEQDGMINNYLSNGVMALFEHDPTAAVRAAVAMKRALEPYNEARVKSGKPPVEIGVAVHKGPLMLGIIGDEKRLDGGVLSDDVNATMALEELSGTLGAAILVPAVLVQGTAEAHALQMRTLGLIEVQGRPMELFDVFEGEGEEGRRLKAKTKELFERAVVLYQQGRFFDAREAFLQVIKQNSDDQAAKLYFYRCDEYYQTGTTKDWNGTLGI